MPLKRKTSVESVNFIPFKQSSGLLNVDVKPKCNPHSNCDSIPKYLICKQCSVVLPNSTSKQFSRHCQNECEEPLTEHHWSLQPKLKIQDLFSSDEDSAPENPTMTKKRKMRSAKIIDNGKEQKYLLWQNHGTNDGFVVAKLHLIKNLHCGKDLQL